MALLKRSRLALFLLLALFIVSISSVGAQNSQKADTLVIAVSIDPINLDPPLARNLVGDSILTAVFDRLGWRSEPYMTPVLWAAKSWKRTDPLTWRIVLKQGIRFQDGGELTSAAVKFSIDRVATLPGADRFYIDQAGISEVRIVDKYSADIITKKPFFLMPFPLANSFYLMEPDYYSKTPPEKLATTPMGSGPYRLVSYVKDDRVSLIRNESYWGTKPAFQHVVFRIIPDPAVRMAELEVGNVDIAQKLPIDKAAIIAGMRNAHPVSLASGRRVFLQAMRKAGTPLADARVMKALQYGIDVDAIIKSLLSGTTKRMATFVNPPNNDPSLKPYPYDPQRARQLLADAGYPNGFSVNLWTSTGRVTRDVQVTEAIASYLKKIGVNATARALVDSVYIDRERKCELDGLFLRSEGPEFSDQGDLQGVSPQDVDYMSCSQWNNPEWQAGYAQLKQESDASKRRILTFKLQQILYNDPPIVMLYNEPDLYGVSNRINWQPRVDQRIYASRVYKR
jgi:peptide/nickel transport system substrate-binding protein